MEACDNKAGVEPSYLGLEGAEAQLQVLGNPSPWKSTSEGEDVRRRDLCLPLCYQPR